MQYTDVEKVTNEAVSRRCEQLM